MSGSYGTRRIDITSLARAKMKRAELDEVYAVCRARGFRLSLMYSGRERTYVCHLQVGGTVYETHDAMPAEAFRKALALRDGPEITSVLTGPAA